MMPMPETHPRSRPCSTPRESVARRRIAALLAGVCLVWSASQAAVPDYSDLDAVLLRNVQRGFVDYAGIRADPAFARFMVRLGETSPADAADTRARSALLINAYNAFAIQGILDGYSPSSPLKRLVFFRQREYRLMGESTTLDELEKQQLMPLRDPRIHFAIVCASISCPRLSSRAYVPDRLDEQLDVAARAFINDNTRNRYDVQRKIAFVSKIFDWYGSDFAATSGSVQKYLSGYVSDQATATLLAAEGFQLRFIPYDWELNGTLPHQTVP
ncbi:MAG: DUF547 domain-containing protein [Gammaproteobacteria bacterium]|nr:DUF547 domain-containing protein [Gammaproteobacteria bacterium]